MFQEPDPNKDQSDRKKKKKRKKVTSQNEPREGDTQFPTRKSPRLNPMKDAESTPKPRKILDGTARKVLNFEESKNDLYHVQKMVGASMKKEKAEKEVKEVKKNKGKQIVVSARRTRLSATSKQTTSGILTMFGKMVRMQFTDPTKNIEYHIDDGVYCMPDSKVFFGKKELESMLTMDWLHNSIIEIHSA